MAMRTWMSEGPLDFGRSVARFSRWGPDPVNVVADGWYHRIARWNGEATPYRARQLPAGAIEVEAGEHLDGAVDDLRYRLAEHLPRAPVERLARRDAIVRRLHRRFAGYRPPLVPDPFEALVTAVCAQQLTLRFATTLRRRLVEHYGRSHAIGGVSVWAFPEPDRLAGLDPSALRSLQFSATKARAIIELARAEADGYLDGLADLEDGQVLARVMALHGVGRWTADWLLARGLGRPKAVAAGDLAVRKAVGLEYLGIGRPADESEVRTSALTWGEAANWVTHLLLEAWAER